MIREGIFGNSNLRHETKSVSNLQRSISILGGSTIVLLGVRRPSVAGLLLTLTGGGLIHFGVTGYCVAYPRLHKNAAAINDEENVARDVHVEKSITINRDAQELYAFWRRFENLPQIMRHLESVNTIDELRSHWVAIGPAGKRFEWDAEIYNEKPNELIAWRSLPEADIVNAGSVRFEPLESGRGTRVRVVANFNFPGGRLTALAAKPFGIEPGQMIEDDLRRFKQLIETGEIATTDGQPTGVNTLDKPVERKASKRALGRGAHDTEHIARSRTRTHVA